MTHTKDIKIILLRDLETEKCTFKQIFASIIQAPKKCENFGWKGNFLSEKKKLRHDASDSIVNFEHVIAGWDVLFLRCWQGFPNKNLAQLFKIEE